MMDQLLYAVPMNMACPANEDDDEPKPDVKLDYDNKMMSGQMPAPHMFKEWGKPTP